MATSVKTNPLPIDEVEEYKTPWLFVQFGKWSFWGWVVLAVILAHLFAATFGGVWGAIYTLLATGIIIAVIWLLLDICTYEVVRPHICMRETFGEIDAIWPPGIYFRIPRIHQITETDTKPITVEDIEATLSTTTEGGQVRIKMTIRARLRLNHDRTKAANAANVRHMKRYLETKEQIASIIRNRALSIAGDALSGIDYEQFSDSQGKSIIRMRLQALIQLLFNEEVQLNDTFDVSNPPKEIYNLVKNAGLLGDQKLIALLETNQSLIEQTGFLVSGVDIIDLEPTKELLETELKKQQAQIEIEIAEKEGEAERRRAEKAAAAIRIKADAEVYAKREHGQADADNLAKKEQALTDQMKARNAANIPTAVQVADSLADGVSAGIRTFLEGKKGS